VGKTDYVNKSTNMQKSMIKFVARGRSLIVFEHLWFNFIKVYVCYIPASTSMFLDI